ncbi:MAG: YezD family protein [Oscillospiraceae bacterium]|nr:YezD family protein [Oscillospiraceae bacterium]
MAENREWKLTEKEEKLLAMLREIRFGEVVIHVADGQPVRAEEVRKSIKF